MKTDPNFTPAQFKEARVLCEQITTETTPRVFCDLAEKIGLLLSGHQRGTIIMAVAAMLADFAGSSKHEDPVVVLLATYFSAHVLLDINTEAERE